MNKNYIKFDYEFWKEYNDICSVIKSIDTIFKYSYDIYPKIYPILTEVYERFCFSFNEQIDKIVLDAPKEQKRYIKLYLTNVFNCFEISLRTLYTYLEEQFKNDEKYDDFYFYYGMLLNSLNFINSFKLN